ncbi:hypothetical protein [Cytobacillus praedii]|uniref:Uncharacterized protein n=1 Tax=Cytobacillus praedii TaxID=1742358 RepID=A0A4R1B1K2_9BACI|nr:hypothetical protein [Cytobacillus praedii]TCJ04720.1 hypothetical protein E0Y62_07890 [Cytobacillus praedii]
MKWGIFFCVLVIIGVIILYEWKKIKAYPKKDRITFFILLIIAGALSLFDLPNLPGPVTLLETIFRPFSNFMESL